MTKDPEVTCDNKALGKWYYPAIFCFGMFLIGIAGAPLYVLGVAYLDESVKKKVAPIYIGFFGSSGTVGTTFRIFLENYEFLCKYFVKN